MAVETFQNARTRSTYSYFDEVQFDLANFFSQSSHFEIIDSYSTHYDSDKDGTPTYTALRYKGDPIADDDSSQPGHKYWEDENDCGMANDWFVVRCTTTIHSTLGLPEWEMKFQFCGSGYYLADVSDTTGTKYPKNHGVQRYVFARFCPWGGWDLADTTPDFNPIISGTQPSPYPSTENHAINFAGTSTSDTRWHLICDDGQFAIIVRNNDGAAAIIGPSCVAGDVSRLSENHMDMPRAMLSGSTAAYTSCTGVNNGDWLCEENNGSQLQSGTADFSSSDAGLGVSFWDNNLILVQEFIKINSNWQAFGPNLGEAGDTQPNVYDSPNFTMDFFPYFPIPITTGGLWFSVPLIRKGKGVGYSFIDDQNWLSMGHGYSLYIKWDGSSVLYA